MPSHERDPDDATEELPELDLPDAGDGEFDETLEDSTVGDERSSPAPNATEDVPTAGDDDALERLAEQVETGEDEPSALGDDDDGIAGDDDHGVDDEQGPSFLGADDRDDGTHADDLDEQASGGEDDGGAEGVDDPEGEELDELPPLDGQRDDVDDDPPSDPLELALDEAPGRAPE